MSAIDPTTSDILYPLSCFDCDESKGVTRARILEAEELPEPYRTLLAHEVTPWVDLPMWLPE